MTNKFTEDVQAIVIPSGNLKWNLERMLTAIKINEERKLDAPYIISGIGRDLNKIPEIKQGARIERREGLEVHYDLWNYMMQNTKGMIGIEGISTNSRENILNTFPKGTKGRYILVSYPLHLKRFEKIVERAKKRGEISKNLEIEYAPTGSVSSPSQILYETARSVAKFLRLR
ncbi:MAG: YdcF family protein [Nanoarchaeota archaeon]|nr:YdcF family protein [Nanoarchaeota archaeon]